MHFKFETADYVFLEEVGLLQEVNGQISRSYGANDKGELHIPFGNLFLFARGIKKKKLNLPLIRITRVGREIATILPPPNMMEVVKFVAGLLLDDLEVCEIQALIPDRNNLGRVVLTTIEKLK